LFTIYGIRCGNAFDITHQLPYYLLITLHLIHFTTLFLALDNDPKAKKPLPLGNGVAVVYCKL